MTVDRARELDEADPLAPLRERFLLPPGVVYLDGNSLGPPTVDAAERLAAVVTEQWGRDLVRSWNVHRWVDLPHRVGDRIAPLIGAPPGSVVVGDSTTVNLYKALGGAVDLWRSEGHRRTAVILTDTANFPTDLYVMGAVARRWGAEVRTVEPTGLEEALEAGDVACLALTQVDYRTGRLHDLPRLTAAAHQVGAITVWDLSHSAGVMPVDVTSADVDLAVGCGYKYLNGGPGAPAYLYVAPRLLDRFANPIAGWFGHAAPFDFSAEFRPAPGIARGRVGTPHVLSMLALDAALDVFRDVDLDLVRAKSHSLTTLFIELVDGLDVELVTPRDPDLRGSQVSLRHPNGYAVVQALAARGVIGDFRAPDVARFGFAPLYIRHVDVVDAARTLAEVLESEAWRDPELARRDPVT